MVATTDVPLAVPSLVIPGPTEGSPPSTITHARAASERHFSALRHVRMGMIHIYALLAFSALRTDVYCIADRVYGTSITNTLFLSKAFLLGDKNLTLALGLGLRLAQSYYIHTCT